jgi:hypothetical protein
MFRLISLLQQTKTERGIEKVGNMRKTERNGKERKT